MKEFLLPYLLFLHLLFPCTSSHVQYKRHTHQHKLKANPRDLLNDFVAISGVGGSEAAPLGNCFDTTDASRPGLDSKKPSGTCGAIESKVKGVMTSNDPKAKSSAIAQQAAQDAKAASDAQTAAGLAAAQHIKAELAEKAFQSAKAAEAALLGKEMMVDQLEKENQQANAVIEGETIALQTIEENMNSAVEATKAATHQFEVLSELAATSKSSMTSMQSVAFGLQKMMEAKVQLLQAARDRSSMFQKQLSSAHEDYEKTKQAAYKAACAAVEAKQNAASSYSSGVKRAQEKMRNSPEQYIISHTIS